MESCATSFMHSEALNRKPENQVLNPKPTVEGIRTINLASYSLYDYVIGYLKETSR